MKEGSGPSQPHCEALVLMLSWADEVDDLKTKDEVNRLGEVFEEKYNYKVVKRQIEKNGKQPQHQVAHFLTQFVYDNDREGALLIIYYAGHGIRGAPGELSLAGYVETPLFGDLLF